MQIKKEHTYSVSAGILLQIMQYLKTINVDTDAFFLSAGIDPALLTLPDERIPVEKYILVEEEGAKAANDPCFGLHMGQFAEAGNWSILGYMMMNCKNLYEAFKKFTKYSSIIGNLIEADVRTNDAEVIIALTVPKNAPVISRHCYEGYFASMLSLARSLSGEAIVPLEAGFAYERPESTSEYDRFFKCPVLFEQKENYIKVTAKAGSIPVLLPNEKLLQYFENYAKEFLADIEEGYNTTYRVKKLILSHVDNEKLSINSIAKELAMSVRTLQGYLKNEGTEFSSLLKETREQLAKKYLKENNTVEDITYLLGFSDVSAFRKAFKKWTGITPREYRETVR